MVWLMNLSSDPGVAVDIHTASHHTSIYVNSFNLLMARIRGLGIASILLIDSGLNTGIEVFFRGGGDF